MAGRLRRCLGERTPRVDMGGKFWKVEGLTRSAEVFERDGKMIEKSATFSGRFRIWSRQ